VIFLQIKLHKLNLAIIILGAGFTSLKKALESLQLTREAIPTDSTKPSVHQTILNISQTYWMYLVFTIIILAGARKTTKIIWEYCKAIMNRSITESSTIQYLTNGSNNIYLKVQKTNPRPMNLNKKFQTFLTKAKITGYCRQTLSCSWIASIISALDGQETIIKQQINLSQREAYIVRQVMRKNFHCHLLLLQGNKLDNIAKINQKILFATTTKNVQMQCDYMAVSITTTQYIQQPCCCRCQFFTTMTAQYERRGKTKNRIQIINQNI